MEKRALLLLTVILYIFSPDSAAGRSIADTDTSQVHELTIYVVPSLYKLDWSSPSSLLETSFKSYSIAVFRKNAYSIGHLFIELSTPLLDSVLLTSIRSTSGAQTRKLVLNERIGLGILGADLHGRMETRKELLQKISHFSASKKLAFIKFRLNKKSTERVIEYIRKFTSRSNNGHAPYDFYGGAFWPGFENEGAGCTSFGLFAMQAAGLSINYPDWMVSINIPMALVGGEYNNHSKVSRREIHRTHKWHNGSGVENVDYIPLSIYDPSLIYNWIIARTDKKDEFVPYIIKDFPGVRRSIKGLYMDARSVTVPENEPLFRQRSKSSLFIDVFKNRFKP